MGERAGPAVTGLLGLTIVAALIAGLATVFAGWLLEDGARRGPWRMWARDAGLPIFGALCVITAGVLMARVVG